MKGSLRFENRRINLQMDTLKLRNALERKMTAIDKDYDEMYFRHYQYKADPRRIQPLKIALQDFKIHLIEYGEILERLQKQKNQEKRSKHG